MAVAENPYITLAETETYSLWLDASVPVLINTFKPVKATSEQFRPHISEIIDTIVGLRNQYPGLHYITDNRAFIPPSEADLLWLNEQIPRIMALGIPGMVTVLARNDDAVAFTECFTQEIAKEGFWNVYAVSLEEAYSYLRMAQTAQTV